MEVDKIIAANLKRLREERNLSLSQLAARSGLSKVTLSQLERGGANPTINNIWKIANALGVPYTSLLDSSSQGAAVIRREELSAQESEGGQCRVLCYYASSAERNFEWFRLELNAGGSYTSVGHRDRALEYVIVQSGTLRLGTQGQEYTLRAGDAVSFKASAPHTYSSEGGEAVTAYIINYYPA